MPGPYLVPGFALQDELELLVEAGFTPLEAIQSATRKIADLVLLEADPLTENKGDSRHHRERAIVRSKRDRGLVEADRNRRVATRSDQ